MNSNQINMISNNVNRIQSTQKILKMMQYIKNKLLSPVILFHQETHSTESNEASWRDEFKVTFISPMDCLVLAEF